MTHSDTISFSNPREPGITVLHTRVMAGTGGGPEKTILRSPRYAEGSPYHMLAAYLHPKNDPGIERLKQQAAQQRCPLVCFAESHPLDTRPLRAMADLCRKFNVRIWHGHDYKSNLFGLLINRVWPMKLITTAHLWTDETWRLRLYKRIDQWCLRHYDHVVAVSTPLAQQCIRTGASSDRVTMVPNGIETEMFTRHEPTSVAKQAFELSPDTPVVGFAGRLSVQKQLIPFVQNALPDLVARDPRTIFLVVGDGPQRKPLEKAAREHSVFDNIRFVGWREDLRPCYEAMDILVQPSRDEGLPNSILEAMAMGVPVVATPVGEVAELLDHGRSGILLDTDPTHWAAPIVSLLNNPSQRDQLAKLARQRIESHYSFRSRMTRIIALYDQLMNPQASMPPIKQAA